VTIKKAAPKAESIQKPQAQGLDRWLGIASWGVAVVMFGLMVWVIFQRVSPASSASTSDENTDPTSLYASYLPQFIPDNRIQGVDRTIQLDTTIPERDNVNAVTYTVEAGDSVFSIANQYDLEPETVLWSNYDLLKNDPQTISVNQVLNIPPTDGVYYQWQSGDTFASVAAEYDVTPDSIMYWPGNNIDLTNPEVEAGDYVMIPGGTGTISQWVIPIPYAAASGSIAGVSTQCAVSAGYNYGSGSFIWPTANHTISGNDFWSGHLGIDIGAYTGDAIFASDSGVVVYAGSMSGGYGNVIILEHDTYYYVYHTVYAHLSAINVTCGQSVVQGQVIGAAGSTGNSTGPHLHFEIRQDGAYINPHQVLGY